MTGASWLEKPDYQDAVGDIVDVHCADGQRRTLTIAEVAEPGLFDRYGVVRYYTDDGRQINLGYDGAGWCEAVDE